MKQKRQSPRERIGRIFRRIYELENRLVAQLSKIPSSEEPHFVARNIARVNGKMLKAVKAVKRVELRAKDAARRTPNKKGK